MVEALWRRVKATRAANAGRGGATGAWVGRTGYHRGRMLRLVSLGGIFVMLALCSLAVDSTRTLRLPPAGNPES